MLLPSFSFFLLLFSPLLLSLFHSLTHSLLSPSVLLWGFFFSIQTNKTKTTETLKTQQKNRNNWEKQKGRGVYNSSWSPVGSSAEAVPPSTTPFFACRPKNAPVTARASSSSAVHSGTILLPRAFGQRHTSGENEQASAVSNKQRQLSTRGWRVCLWRVCLCLSLSHAHCARVHGVHCSPHSSLKLWFLCFGVVAKIDCFRFCL